MKKFLIFALFCLSISLQSFANTDTSFVVVRGPAQIAEYKNLLSSEATNLIRKAIGSVEGVAVEDCTAAVYRRYNLSLQSEGPSNTQIVNYIQSLDNRIYDKKIIFVFDFYIIGNNSYLTLRLLKPSGIEISSSTVETYGTDYQSWKYLINSVGLL